MSHAAGVERLVQAAVQDYHAGMPLSRCVRKALAALAQAGPEPTERAQEQSGLIRDLEAVAAYEKASDGRQVLRDLRDPTAGVGEMMPTPEAIAKELTHALYVEDVSEGAAYGMICEALKRVVAWERKETLGIIQRRLDGLRDYRLARNSYVPAICRELEKVAAALRRGAP